ncbi:MAG: leucine-rich repeat domain-containing protein [Coprobacillaceae bacterium]
MKSKILISLLAGGLVVGLTTPSIVKAEDLEESKENYTVSELNSEETQVENEVIESNEEKDTETLLNDIMGVEDTSVRKEKSNLQAKVSALVTDQTKLGDAFPDINFRKYVAETVLGLTTYDENYKLNSADITKINTRTGIHVLNSNITSLEGIQFFTDLLVLSCQGNQISELNLTALTKLKTLNCYNNTLIVLDISGLTELTGIQCYNNKIEVLDVSAATNLTMLHVANNQIKVLDVTNLTSLTSLDCYDNKISVLNVSDLTNLTNLHCYNNQIEVLDVTNLTNLTSLHCANNNISTLDVSKMDNLTVLSCANTNVDTINISTASKSKNVTLRYDFTNIDSLDLNGFTALRTLSATKATGGTLSNLTYVYFSAGRETGSMVIRVQRTAGFMSWDSSIGFYALTANSGIKYAMGVSYIDDEGNPQIAMATYLDLVEGGLMDSVGNLIVGAVPSNVDPVTGVVTLPSGGKYITTDTVYEFDEEAIITDTKITTTGKVTIEKNTAVVNENTGLVEVVVGGNQTVVEIPTGGEGALEIATGEMELSSGTIVTNNDGDKTYLPEGGEVDNDGNVTSNDRTITVPSDKTASIPLPDTDGNIVLPEGSIVTDNGTDVTYPGNIVYNPEDNSVKYMPIDGLVDDNGKIKDTVTQADLDESKNIINQLPESDLKNELKIT